MNLLPLNHVSGPLPIQQTTCALCGSHRIDIVLSLPNLPLTGLVSKKHFGGPSEFNQALVKCYDCEHFQLLYVVPPDVLYGENYVYRTSANKQSATANTSYIKFVEAIIGDQRFNCILELGCNDGSTLARFADRSQELFGIDPIWRLNSKPPEVANLNTIPKFIEDVNFCTDLSNPPDLILSSHNLEHIQCPEYQMHRVVEASADGALFVFEVPALEPMFDHRRYDKVFHEHLHYFSLNTLRSMINRLGCQLVHHDMSATWGGSHQIAFRKARSASSITLFNQPSPSNEQILTGYNWFRGELRAFTDMALNFPKPIWGYGAGQQLPVLAYHLQTDFHFLEGLLDDDPHRSGLGYRTIDLTITTPSNLPKQTISESTILVTALDSVRPILKRLNDFEPRHILLPSDVV